MKKPMERKITFSQRMKTRQIKRTIAEANPFEDPFNLFSLGTGLGLLGLRDSQLFKNGVEPETDEDGWYKWD